MHLNTTMLRAATAVAAATAAAGLLVPATSARTAYSGNPCTLLSPKQVSALHIGTSCTKRTGLANPYYSGVTAIWGQLGGGHGSITLAVNKVKRAAYVNIFESQNKSGKSAGVGGWSRGKCAQTGVYCIVTFVVGTYVVELQVGLPTGHPLASSKPVIALAKSVAAKL